MSKQWIQKALKGHKVGALHRQLGIPIEENISFETLRRIQEKKIGEYVFIPQSTFDNEKFKVTPLLKRRANLALNLRRMK